MNELINDIKFKTKHKIKIFETDSKENLKISILMNLFQEIAEDNIEKMGLGYDFLKKNEIAWVALNYDIKINKMPKRSETITIETWPKEKYSIYAIRDFVVKDENEEILIIATSRWTLINMQKRRPVPYSKYMPDFPLNSECAYHSDFDKISDRINNDFEKDYIVLFDDLDVNNHVNNAVYSIWSLNSVPNDFRLNHNPKRIEINFRQEAKLEDKIKIQTQIDNLTSINIVKRNTDDAILAFFRVNWEEN